MDWYYETDVVRNPITKKLETIYRKYQLRYTGKIIDIPQTANADQSDIIGGYSVEESVPTNVKRISKEEYDDRIHNGDSEDGECPLNSLAGTEY